MNYHHHTFFFFVDRSNTPNMRPAKDTHKFHEVLPIKNPTTCDADFLCPHLWCSYPSCREDHAHVEGCAHDGVNNIERKSDRERSENDNETEGGLSDLTTRELKDMMRMHGMWVSGNKDVLVSILVPFPEQLSNRDGISEDVFDVDADDQNNEDSSS